MTEISSVNITPAMPVYQKPHFKDYPDVLTVQEASELLSVCKNTIYKLVKERELPSRKIGSAIRIRKKDVLAYMAGTNMN